MPLALDASSNRIKSRVNNGMYTAEILKRRLSTIVYPGYQGGRATSRYHTHDTHTTRNWSTVAEPPISCASRRAALCHYFTQAPTIPIVLQSALRRSIRPIPHPCAYTIRAKLLTLPSFPPFTRSVPSLSLFPPLPYARLWARIEKEDA